MVVISEITDDDNGDKKSPQELPGGETRIITTTTRRCSLESIPLDVTECIVASFSRYEYPAIALLTKESLLEDNSLTGQFMDHHQKLSSETKKTSGFLLCNLDPGTTTLSLLYLRKKKMKENFGNDDDDNLAEKVLELDPGNTTLRTYI
ncbi:hypothetical protein YC2023_039634 [Brassica napus]